MSKLRSKIMSIVVAAGLMAAAAAPVSAALTPSSTVSLEGYSIVLETYQLSKTTETGGIGDNNYLKMSIDDTKTDGRFYMRNPSSVNSGSKFMPKDATKPMVWNMDVYPLKNLSNIVLQTNGSVAMSEDITPAMLNASTWNNLTLVYYPNTTDTSKMGSADLYINGEYVSTKDLSGNSTESYGKEYRFYVKGTAAGDVAYMDNIKLAEAEGFTAPSLTSTSLTVGNGTISGYAGGATVETVKGQLIASANADVKIYNADGTEASDETKVTAGMKAVAEIEVTGVNTYTKTYTFANYEVLAQVTTSTQTALNENWYASVAVAQASAENGNRASVKFAPTGTEKITFSLKDSAGTRYNKNCGGGKTVIYSFDIYSNTNFSRLFLATTSENKVSEYVYPSALNAGEWNRIAFVLNPAGTVATGSRVDTYVNGKLVFRGYYSGDPNADQFNTEPLRLNITPTETKDPIYISDLYLAKLSEFNRPFIGLENCVTEIGNTGDGRVNGYGAMTIAGLKATATMADDVSIDKFYNANGEEIADDSTPLAPGMYVTVKTDYSDTNKYAFYANNYTYRYNIGAAYYSFGAAAFKSGETVLEAPVDGTITASMDVNAYTDKVTGFAILAEYDTDGKLLRVAQDEYTYNKSEKINNTVTRSLENCSAANTYKFFVWNSLEGLKSLKNASVLSPAQPE